MPLKVRSPGQFEWPHLTSPFSTLRSWLSQTWWPSALKVAEYNRYVQKRLKSVYLGFFLYRWPKVIDIDLTNNPWLRPMLQLASCDLVWRLLLIGCFEAYRTIFNRILVTRFPWIDTSNIVEEWAWTSFYQSPLPNQNSRQIITLHVKSSADSEVWWMPW